MSDGEREGVALKGLLSSNEALKLAICGQES